MTKIELIRQNLGVWGDQQRDSFVHVFSVYVFLHFSQKELRVVFQMSVRFVNSCKDIIWKFRGELRLVQAQSDDSLHALRRLDCGSFQMGILTRVRSDTRWVRKKTLHQNSQMCYATSYCPISWSKSVHRIIFRLCTMCCRSWVQEPRCSCSPRFARWRDRAPGDVIV